MKITSLSHSGLAVMLAIKRSVGVASEVNLRNSLHADDEAYKQEFYISFKIQDRHY